MREMSSSSPPPSSCVTFLSKTRVHPEKSSTMEDLKLSVSDLPMLSCHYIQKGLFFSQPPIPIPLLLHLLTQSLAKALTFFPALAGRLTTGADHRIFITCNDAGVDFIHAIAPTLVTTDVLPFSFSDVPKFFKQFFTLDYTLSYSGHFQPLSGFQLTELADGAVFIGVTVNHAIVDGTSFWNFFNAWAELCRTGGSLIVSVGFQPIWAREITGLWPNVKMKKKKRKLCQLLEWQGQCGAFTLSHIDDFLSFIGERVSWQSGEGNERVREESNQEEEEEEGG